MIKSESISIEWLSERRKKYSKDPAIMEAMIYALYLLEQLKLTGLEFLFKGGTSLLLLMEQPKRFSVDLDILLSPEVSREKLEGFLSKIVASSAFTLMKLDERRSYQKSIPKAHYKFFYRSNVGTKDKEGNAISNPQREILLDIIFAENTYPVVVERPIDTEWLLQEGEVIRVKMPDIDSITGDKMTAFAPNTTGVPYGIEKEKEIMKQLFDIGCLFDELSDIEVVKQSFRRSVKAEIEYRPERKIESAEQVLQDIIDTSLLISGIVNLSKNEESLPLKEINSGINQFKHYIFEGNFGLLEAKVSSSKAAFLAAIILKDYKGNLPKFSLGTPLANYLINNPEYTYLNKRLKFVARGEALFYWYQTLKLLFS
ncbi:MAG: nucleotidyl transferase AbiEii/AbiGii toxin family protein [Bacteroidales bacterium]|nr:nucleotidyl transferase AbiEii/AbiGii toxin family protein [Bacteroidales bacterium]